MVLARHLFQRRNGWQRYLWNLLRRKVSYFSSNFSSYFSSYDEKWLAKISVELAEVKGFFFYLAATPNQDIGHHINPLQIQQCCIHVISGLIICRYQHNQFISHQRQTVKIDTKLSPRSKYFPPKHHKLTSSSFLETVTLSSQW